MNWAICASIVVNLLALLCSLAARTFASELTHAAVRFRMAFTAVRVFSETWSGDCAELCAALTATTVELRLPSSLATELSTFPRRLLRSRLLFSIFARRLPNSPTAEREVELPEREVELPEGELWRPLRRLRKRFPESMLALRRLWEATLGLLLCDFLEETECDLALAPDLAPPSPPAANC